MRICAHRFILTIVISVALSGCATSERPALQPVENLAPVKPDGLYEAKDVDVAPQLRVPAIPRYPSELKKAGIGGEASVLFTVKADGSVTDAIVLSATDVRFGAAAQASILKWQYKPATRQGLAVDCQMTQTLKFTVTED